MMTAVRGARRLESGDSIWSNGHAIDREGSKIKAEIETLRQRTGAGATINDLGR